MMQVAVAVMALIGGSSIQHAGVASQHVKQRTKLYCDNGVNPYGHLCMPPPGNVPSYDEETDGCGKTSRSPPPYEL